MHGDRLLYYELASAVLEKEVPFVKSSRDAFGTGFDLATSNIGFADLHHSPRRTVATSSYSTTANQESLY
jgi:hypothetical protein